MPPVGYDLAVRRTFLLLPLSIFLLSCTSNHVGMQNVGLTNGSRHIQLWVGIADEPQEQRVGLQARASLPRDQGMLFVFEFPQSLTFWMKETLLPLDVLFFDEEKNFVSSQTMDPCKSDPCQTYPSSAPAKYALEVNAGFVEKQGVGAGWKLELYDEI